jgi:hypothetical protein
VDIAPSSGTQDPGSNPDRAGYKVSRANSNAVVFNGLNMHNLNVEKINKGVSQKHFFIAMCITGLICIVCVFT